MEADFIKIQRMVCVYHGSLSRILYVSLALRHWQLLCHPAFGDFGCVILYVFMGLWLDRRDRKKEKDFMRFLEKPGSSPNEIELYL
mgnify:CR=1 FL=1